MNRRDFAAGFGLATAGLAAPALVNAQGGPVEGRDFVRLDSPVPVPAGPIEVVEFFGYWCPHCNAFEPTLSAWADKLPPDVKLRRMSVSFRAPDEAVQRLFFATEALGLESQLHHKVFDAIHRTRKLPSYPTESQIEAFLKDNGVDAQKVLSAMKGFAVATKVRQAKQLAMGYGIDSVPTLGIQGRWRTSPAMARSQERALQVVDALIAQARKS